jgi:hypothetical protein
VPTSRVRDVQAGRDRPSRRGRSRSPRTRSPPRPAARAWRPR